MGDLRNVGVAMDDQRTMVCFLDGLGDIGRAAVRLRCLETGLDLIAEALEIRA